MTQTQARILLAAIAAAFCIGAGLTRVEEVPLFPDVLLGAVAFGVLMLSGFAGMIMSINYLIDKAVGY